MRPCLGPVASVPVTSCPAHALGSTPRLGPASEDSSHLPVQAADAGSYGHSPAPAPSDLGCPRGQSPGHTAQSDDVRREFVSRFPLLVTSK